MTDDKFRDQNNISICIYLSIFGMLEIALEMYSIFEFYSNNS